VVFAFYVLYLVYDNKLYSINRSSNNLHYCYCIVKSEKSVALEEHVANDTCRGEKSSNWLLLTVTEAGKWRSKTVYCELLFFLNYLMFIMFYLDYL